MEFRVLGPVEVRVKGQRLDVGHARQRAVLAVLLLELNQVVPADRLIDRVWGDDPPSSVRNVVYGLVARLKAALAAIGEPDVALSRRAGGYVLEADQDSLDLRRFSRQVAEAAAVGDDGRAAGLLREALELWRGEALGGLSSTWIGAMRQGLEQQRMAAILDLNDIRLRQGQHGALVSQLADLAVAQPADERLAGQLMLALYRSGRQAEALQFFEQLRLHLADQVGADPGPALRALHQQILKNDPSLSVEPDARPATRILAPTVPRELPSDVFAFVGRDQELAELDRLAAGAGGATEAEPGPQGDAAADPAAMVISAVAGTAGVGKTALAVRWAHRVAGRFPDGQLYINLRGYDPGEPMPAADALAVLLRALGVPGQEVPAQLDERAARYRSLLAGRRIVVVLDNARDTEQVRPLLPGGPGSMVLITSRDALAGLVAREGARRLLLDLMPPADATKLLRVLIGGRIDDDPEAAALLAERCCRLPLALRVAAEVAAAQPTVPLADLVSELAGEKQLDVLDADGDKRTAVRVVFSWSYLRLEPEAARGFGLAGLHPGTDLDPAAMAALMGTTPHYAQRVLRQLTRAHLMSMVQPGRYGMHDLLRAYARELAAAGSKTDRDAALTSLFDYYLHAAAAAMDILYPAEASRRPRIEGPLSTTSDMHGEDGARTWLDAERANMVAMAVHAADHGWPGHATRLAATLFRYLDIGGHYGEALTIHSHARRAAAESGDATAEAGAVSSLASIDLRQGRYQRATIHFRESLNLYRRIGDRTGEARTLHNLGLIELRLGHLAQATDYLQQALVLYRENADQMGAARALSNLGGIDIQQGRYEQASGYQQQALSLFREKGDRLGEFGALTRLGIASRYQGQLDQAYTWFQQALMLNREVGDRIGQADVLVNLGDLGLLRADYEVAVDHLQQALIIYRETGNRASEAEALNLLGDAYLGTGHPDQALGQHTAVLRLAEDAGRREEAHAHDGLAAAYQATGHLSLARPHWEQALALYAELNAPEAERIRAHLAGAQENNQLPVSEGASRDGARPVS